MQAPSRGQALLWSSVALMLLNALCALGLSAGGRALDGTLMFTAGCVVIAGVGVCIAALYRSPER